MNKFVPSDEIIQYLSSKKGGLRISISGVRITLRQHFSYYGLYLGNKLFGSFEGCAGIFQRNSELGLIIAALAQIESQVQPA